MNLSPICSSCLNSRKNFLRLVPSNIYSWDILKHRRNSFTFLLALNSRLLRCSTARGGGLIPGCSLYVPLRLGLRSLFFSLKFPLQLKIKNTCLILMSHFRTWQISCHPAITLKKKISCINTLWTLFFYLKLGQIGVK